MAGASCMVTHHFPVRHRRDQRSSTERALQIDGATHIVVYCTENSYRM